MKFLKTDDNAAWIAKNKDASLYRRIARPIPWHRLPPDRLPVCFVEKEGGRTQLIVPQKQDEQRDIHRLNWPMVSWHYVDKKTVLKLCPDWRDTTDDPPEEDED